MKRIVFGMMLLALTASLGCKNTIGPVASKKRPDIDPLLSIEEQKRYGAERYSYIEDNINLTPRGFADRPSPSGR